MPPQRRRMCPRREGGAPQIGGLGHELLRLLAPDEVAVEAESHFGMGGFEMAGISEIIEKGELRNNW